MPRAVIVSQSYPPESLGTAARMHDNARKLVEQGWDITVLTPPPTFPFGSFDRTWQRSQTERDGRITVHRLWTWQPQAEDPGFVQRILYYALFAFHALAWLLVRRRSADVIVPSSPPMFVGLASLPFALVGRTPVVVDVRDLWIDAAVGLDFISDGGLFERLSRRYVQLVFRTADRVTVTTPLSKDKLVDRYGLDERRVHLIPNGVDTELFTPESVAPTGVTRASADGEDGASPAAQARGTDGTAGSDDIGRSEDPAIRNSDGSDDGATVVYLGNVGHAKDLETAIRAIGRLDARGIDVTFRIIGDGDRRAALERMVVEEGLEAVVEFTGMVPREAIPGYLREADLGLSPLKPQEALEYCVPVKTYEYMACGVPVVTTGAGEVESLIDESGAGVVVENNPDRVAYALEQLLGDDAYRRRLGANGRQFVVERYDRGVIAEQLSEILADVVRRSRSASTT